LFVHIGYVVATHHESKVRQKRRCTAPAKNTVNRSMTRTFVHPLLLIHFQ